MTEMSQSRQRTLFKRRELEVRANQAHQFRIRCGFAILPIVVDFVLELDDGDICVQVLR